MWHNFDHPREHVFFYSRLNFNKFFIFRARSSLTFPSFPLCPDNVHFLGFFLKIVFLSLFSFTILLVLFLFLMLVVDVFYFFSIFIVLCPESSLCLSLWRQIPNSHTIVLYVFILLLFRAKAMKIGYTRVVTTRWMNSLPEEEFRLMLSSSSKMN